MELVVLVDNNTLIDQYYFGEPGLCFYLVDEDKKFLFDTGYSDLFIKNAELMKIDINDIDGIIISHGHEDHTNGLKYYLNNFKDKKKNLYSHPLAFNKKLFDDEIICSALDFSMLDKNFNIITAKEPMWLTERLLFLGEIPTFFEYEKRYDIGMIEIDGKFMPDYLFDDTALVYKGSDGLFIITGCSHGGICNIIEYAKQVCDEDKISGVIGGFHLDKDDSKIGQTIKYFKQNNIKYIYPCHCTSLYAKSKILNEMTDCAKEVGTGLKINIK